MASEPRAATDSASRRADRRATRPPSEQARDELVGVGSRLRAWPDSQAALLELAPRFQLVALSNGTMAELARLSRNSGLLWHAVLSSELVATYKPSSAVYEMAIDRLELDPARTMMVAAHPCDLRAASRHGLRTAFVDRPGEGDPAEADHFDLSAGDLDDLAQQLIES